MRLVRITPEFMVDPNEVSALEAYEHWASDPGPSGDSFLDHSGTIVIQKCGRKTYLKHVTVEQCHRALEQGSPKPQPDLKQQGGHDGNSSERP